MPSLSSRALGAVLACCLAAPVLAGCGDSPLLASPKPTDASSSSASPSTTTEAPPPELPQGGRMLFPDYRLVGYAGYPGAKRLGRLGLGDPDEKVQEIVKLGASYADGRKILPTLELIATTVQPRPGRDGKYRSVCDEAIIQKHLDLARKYKGILLLAIQPGRSDFVTEVKHYEKWLKEPDVGVALDPEWRMGPTQIPMRQFGSVTGKELNDTADYLQSLVMDYDLPEKVMLYHQLHVGIVKKEEDLKPHAGLAMIKSVDGIGSPPQKIATWDMIMKDLPAFVHPGFKLFFEEDVQYGKVPIMTPQQVMALTPTPSYVLYE